MQSIYCLVVSSSSRSTLYLQAKPSPTDYICVLQHSICVTNILIVSYCLTGLSDHFKNLIPSAMHYKTKVVVRTQSPEFVRLTYLNAETVNKPGGTELIPTVTAFVPSLAAGLPFYVSIQSWIGTPQPTLQSPHIPAESIAWEARLFIDGKLVAHTEIGHEENWPITMEVRLVQRKSNPDLP